MLLQFFRKMITAKYVMRKHLQCSMHVISLSEAVSSEVFSYKLFISFTVYTHSTGNSLLLLSFIYHNDISRHNLRQHYGKRNSHI